MQDRSWVATASYRLTGLTKTITTPTRVFRTTNVTGTFSEEVKYDTLSTSSLKLEEVGRKGSHIPVAATVRSKVVSDPATNKSERFNERSK
jgi:hypothetical protein